VPALQCFASGLCGGQPQELVCLKGVATGGFQSAFSIDLREWTLPLADQKTDACTREVSLFNSALAAHESQHEAWDVEEIDSWNRMNGNGSILAQACAPTGEEAQAIVDGELAQTIKDDYVSLLRQVKGLGEPPGIPEINCAVCPE
jgi:hypothetical protein